MATKTTKIQEIEFDLTKALIVIENDSDLDDMFRTKYGTEYKMCHTLIHSGTGLKPKAETYVKALFDGVILESTRLKKKYQSLGKDPVREVEPVRKVKSEDKAKHSKKVVNKKRWGLQAIASDIVDNFKGKGKQIHRTGKKVQELKKIFSRLEIKMFNERFIKETFTDAQLREISGAIETFNKKVDSVLNPKK